MASVTKTIRKRQGNTAGRRRPPPEFCHYVVAIEDWDWSLSFGIGDPGHTHNPEPYNDYRHLLLWGALLRPGQHKVRAVELTLLPNGRLGRDYWPEGSPNGVGSLSINTNRDRVLQGLLTLPADALTQILTMLAAGRLKYVVMDGQPLRHRRTMISNYTLKRTLDDDDGELHPDP